MFKRNNTSGKDRGEAEALAEFQQAKKQHEHAQWLLHNVAWVAKDARIHYEDARRALRRVAES